MHYAISYHLARARIADLRHDAQRDTMARAARGLGCRRPGLRPWVLHRTGAEPGTAQAAQPAAAGDTPACRVGVQVPLASTRPIKPSPFPRRTVVATDPAASKPRPCATGRAAEPSRTPQPRCSS